MRYIQLASEKETGMQAGNTRDSPLVKLVAKTCGDYFTKCIDRSPQTASLTGRKLEKPPGYIAS